MRGPWLSAVVFGNVALGLGLAALCSVSACSLNPQPEPPGEESKPVPGSSTGAGGSSGAAGSKASPGGSGGAYTSGGQGGEADTPAGAGGSGASSNQAGQAGQAGQGGSAPVGAGGASGGVAGESGGGGEGGSGGLTAGMGGSSGSSTGAGGEAGSGGAQGGSSGAGGAPAPSVDQACSALAQATCSKWQACSPFELQSTYGDLEACLPRVKAACEKQLAAPGSNTSNGQHLACASDIEAASCDAFLTGAVGGACVPAPGERAAGAPCGDDAQCKSGFCDRSGPCGACAEAPKAGAPCPASGDCGPGLSCSAQSGTCAAYAGLGAPCGAAPCLPSLSCKAGACAKPIGDGEPCVEGECDELSGSTCSGGVCTKISQAVVGQSCGPQSAPPVVCSAASHCLAQQGAPASCIADLPDGASCSSTSASCRILAACIGGVCAIPDPGACE